MYVFMKDPKDITNDAGQCCQSVNLDKSVRDGMREQG